MKPLVFFCLLLFAPSALAQRYYPVLSIRDGDTLRIIGQKKAVRLLGINAREIDGPFGHKAEVYGYESKAALDALLRGQKVRVGYEPRSRFDRCNDRVLLYLWRVDGLFINLEMVRRGHAAFERRFYTRYAKELLAAEEEARAAGRGMWAEAKSGHDERENARRANNSISIER